MNGVDQEQLKAFARKYLWWKSPDDVAPQRVIAQVMNLGDYGDVQALAAQVGDEALREVLTRSSPGEFNARSWAYWHYRLGLCQAGQLPAMPERKFV